jgi:Domain of unknown function DUF11
MLSRSRRPLHIVLVVATLAALLAMPLTVAAGGKPRGVTATLSIAPRIAMVSVGGDAAFEVTFANGGNGTLTHVRFTGTVPGGRFVSASPRCTGSGGQVACEFDNLGSGASVTFTVTFDRAGPGTIELTGTMRVASGGNNPNATSDDTSTDKADVPVTNDPDFFGSWQAAHSNTKTYATGGTGSGNGQTTSLAVPPVGFAYPATLSEIDAPIVCGGDTITGFGEAVDLSVANGLPVEPHLTLTLTYKKSVIGWVDASDVGFVHQLDNGACQFPPRGCNKWNDGFCFDAWWSGDWHNKKLNIRVELPSNGRGKGI